MSNDYNQLGGPPVVRVGNWQEEAVLLEVTGFTRQRTGANVGTDDTGLRCLVNKDITNTWTTTSNPPGSVSHPRFYDKNIGKAFDGDGNVGSVDAVLPSRNKLTKETIDQQARRAYIAAKEAESRRVFEDVANPFEGKAKLNRTKEMKFERAPVVSDPLAADAITLYSSETIFQKADRPSFGRKKLRFEPEDAPLK